MALTNTPVFVQTPNIGFVSIANADTSNSKNIMTGGANGSKVESLNFASSDTSNRIVQIYLVRSGTAFLLGTANVAANSGADNLVPSVNAFDSTYVKGLPLDSDGQVFLFLKSADQLNVKSTTTVTSGKTIDCTAVFGDF